MEPHENPTTEELRTILTEARTIAVVGASSNPEKASNRIMQRLLAAGYRVFPVNPNEREVLGLPAYARLSDVPEPIDIVDVFRRAEHTPALADEAAKVGAKTFWLQSGIWNEEAAVRAKAGGLRVVMDACTGALHSMLQIRKKAAA